MSPATLLRLFALPTAFAGVALGGCAQLPAAAPSLGAPASLGSPAGLVGLDPYDTRCASDAVTAARTEARDASGRVVALIDLRRSERCGTTWARAVRVAPARGALVATVRGQGHTSSFEHATDGEVWTDMVPSDRGCATASGGVRAEDGRILDAQASWCDASAAVGLASK